MDGQQNWSRTRIIGAGLFLWAGCALTIGVDALAAPAVDDLRAGELVRLVRQDCGSCHGMTLRGGLGSPLLPDALRDKPAEGLVATVLQGRPGTAMPAWRGIISEAEARWIVDRLMAGFPEEGSQR